MISRLSFSVFGVCILMGANCPVNPDPTLPGQTLGPSDSSTGTASTIPSGFYFITRHISQAWTWIGGTRIDQTPPDITNVISIGFDFDGWPMYCDSRLFVGYVDFHVNGRPMKIVRITQFPNLVMDSGAAGPGFEIEYSLQPQAPNPTDLLPINEGMGVVKVILLAPHSDADIYMERDFLVGTSSTFGIEGHSQQWLRKSPATIQQICE